MTQSMQFQPELHTGYGLRLRQAREAAGLSLDDVSHRLKMPARVLRALEAGDWAVLGAPVFVRGQLRSYSRLLGVVLPEEIADPVLASPAPAALVSHMHTPRYRRVAEHAAKRAVYIVLTVTLVAPVWIATRSHLSGDLAPAQSLELPAGPSEPAVAAPAASAEPAHPPLVASMASLPESAPAPQRLTMKFVGDSWLEVFASDGRPIEQGLLIAGQTRSFPARQVGRVVLGNSTAVEVQHAGKAIDLAPYSRANVARFALSSDGSLAPVLD